MIKKEDYTWTHKGWVIIRHNNEFNLWKSDDSPGRQCRGLAPSLRLARYLIDQDKKEKLAQLRLSWGR